MTADKYEHFFVLVWVALKIVNVLLHAWVVGRDSSVGIATRYGLDGPGIESQWGREFPHPSRPAVGPTKPPTQWVPGVRRPGRGVDHPPYLVPRLKKE